ASCCQPLQESCVPRGARTVRGPLFGATVVMRGSYAPCFRWPRLAHRAGVVRHDDPIASTWTKHSVQRAESLRRIEDGTIAVARTVIRRDGVVPGREPLDVTILVHHPVEHD